MTESAAIVIICNSIVAIWLMNVTSIPFYDEDKNTTGWN